MEKKALKFYKAYLKANDIKKDEARVNQGYFGDESNAQLLAKLIKNGKKLL